MNPLRDFVIINPMLRNKKARILNHGFGQRALFTPLTWVVNLWSKGWWSLRRSWMRMNSWCSFRGSPQECSSLYWGWHVLTGITELIQGMVCFISLATRFPDPRPGGHGELTPLGELFALCRSGWGQPFLKAKLTHSECGFPSHGFSETSSRAPMPKEGNRISQPPLGIECQRGSLHNTTAPVAFQNGTFSSLHNQLAGPPEAGLVFQRPYKGAPLPCDSMGWLNLFLDPYLHQFTLMSSHHPIPSLLLHRVK